MALVLDKEVITATDEIIEIDTIEGANFTEESGNRTANAQHQGKAADFVEKEEILDLGSVPNVEIPTVIDVETPDVPSIPVEQAEKVVQNLEAAQVKAEAVVVEKIEKVDEVVEEIDAKTAIANVAKKDLEAKKTIAENLQTDAATKKKLEMEVVEAEKVVKEKVAEVVAAETKKASLEKEAEVAVQTATAVAKKKEKVIEKIEAIADFSPLPTPQKCETYKPYCVGFFESPDGPKYGACMALPDNKCPATWRSGCIPLKLSALDTDVSNAEVTVMW